MEVSQFSSYDSVYMRLISYVSISRSEELIICEVSAHDDISRLDIRLRLATIAVVDSIATLQTL